MASNLGTLTVDLIAKTSNFVDGLSKAERESKKFRAGVEKNLKAAGTAFVALGIAGAAATAALIKSSIDTADAMSKQSQAIGVNIEDLSALNYAAGLADVGFEELTGGLSRFSKTARDAFEGVGEGADAFRQLDIDVKNSDGSIKSSGDLVSEVAGRFAAMENGILKTALAQDLFGRSGAKLIPLLNGGAEGLKDMREEAERLGHVIDRETGLAAEEFNDNLTKMKSAITGIGNELAAELLPSLNELTGIINDEDFQNGIKEFVSFIADGVVVAAKLAEHMASVAKYAHLLRFVGGPIGLAANARGVLGSLADPADNLSQSGTVDRTKPVVREPFTPVIVNDEATKAQEELNKLINDRLDGYREQIILQGRSTELAKLQADIELGKFAGAKPEQLDELQSEAMYADSIAAEQELNDLIQSRIAGYGNVINALGEMSAVAQLNFDIAQGAFPRASEEDIANMRAYAESVDAIAWADKRREANEAFAEMEAGLERQIALVGETSDAAILLYDIEHGGYDQFRQDQQDKLLLLAQELEAREQVQQEIEEAAKAQQKIMDDLVENTQNILADFLKGSFDDGLKGAVDRFKQMLADLAAEAVAADIMKYVTGSFGKGKSGSDTGSTIGSVISAFAGLFDSGGNIGSGQWGIVGEMGPEIVRGPAHVTSREDTAAMMGSKNSYNNTFVFPNVRTKDEAAQAGVSAAREFLSTLQFANRRR